VKNIVILGSTPAAARIIETLRAKDTESAITLVSFDGDLPGQRNRYADFVAGTCTGKDLDCQSAVFYSDRHVRVIADKKFNRVNFNRGRVFLEGEEKENLQYDVLVFCDLPSSRFPDIKGINKTGVFGLRKRVDIEMIQRQAPLIDAVMVQSDSLAGFKMAAAVASLGQETILVLPGNGDFTRQLGAGVTEKVKKDFEENRLRLIWGAEITEILGDADLKAVRLATGRVIAADMVIFDEKQRDLRLFADSAVTCGERICVDGDFRTADPRVFACGDICQTGEGCFFEHLSDQRCALQGEKIARAILEETFEMVEPADDDACLFAGCRVSLSGDVLPATPAEK
jgi:NAD(P)H-nitrite reductase large subunit